MKVNSSVNPILQNITTKIKLNTSDKKSITDKAKNQTQAHVDAKSIASELAGLVNPSDDEQRIQAIKDKLSNGEHRIDIDKLAKNLLDSCSSNDTSSSGQ